METTPDAWTIPSTSPPAGRQRSRSRSARRELQADLDDAASQASLQNSGPDWAMIPSTTTDFTRRSQRALRKAQAKKKKERDDEASADDEAESQEIAEDVDSGEPARQASRGRGRGRGRGPGSKKQGSCVLRRPAAARKCEGKAAVAMKAADQTTHGTRPKPKEEAKPKETAKPKKGAKADGGAKRAKTVPAEAAAGESSGKPAAKKPLALPGPNMVEQYLDAAYGSSHRSPCTRRRYDDPSPRQESPQATAANDSRWHVRHPQEFFNLKNTCMEMVKISHDVTQATPKPVPQESRESLKLILDAFQFQLVQTRMHDGIFLRRWLES